MLLRKLAKNGQAILCTIHQPSAILLQQFDRLLLISKHGRTLYFGEIGVSSHTMISYFERNGARPCARDENPAEWMLEVTATGNSSEKDWSVIWRDSEEYTAVKTELAKIKDKASLQPTHTNDADALEQFAAPFNAQLRIVCCRAFQQYWRTPSYLYSKAALCFFSVSDIHRCLTCADRMCSPSSSAFLFGRHPIRSRVCRINSTQSSYF